MIRLIASLSVALLLAIGCFGCNRECCIEEREQSTQPTPTAATPPAPTAANSAPSNLGEFSAQTDVGTVVPPGSAEVVPSERMYTIKSGGENIWAKHDDFHFVYRQATGDCTLIATIELDSAGKNAHRKAGLMMRQDLTPDSPYADVMVHGDGSIALQYRKTKGDITTNTKSTVTAPARVRIARQGNTFTVFAAPKGGKFETVGTVDLELKDPIYMGLAVSAHDKTAVETAVFSHVEMKLGK